MIEQATTMRALSLWQPWASALVLGIKATETRSWPMPSGLRGATVAIHASKRRPSDHMLLGSARPWEIVANGLGNPGFHVKALEELLDAARDALPYGAIVGAVKFGACFLVREAYGVGPIVREVVVEEVNGPRHPTAYLTRVQGHDAELGDFSQGRYLWQVEKAVRLETPIEARGHQGVFTLKRELTDQVRQALQGHGL